MPTLGCLLANREKAMATMIILTTKNAVAKEMIKRYKAPKLKTPTYQQFDKLEKVYNEYKRTRDISILRYLFALKVTVTDAPMANYSWTPDNSIFSKEIHALNIAGRYDKLWRREHGMELLFLKVLRLFSMLWMLVRGRPQVSFLI